MPDSWQIAAFRFEMISPLLDDNLTEAQKRRIIRDRTRRAVRWPCSPDKKPIGRSTLFRWLKDYREKGFLGLMPKVIDLCYEAIIELKKNGLTILIVEQSTQRALEVADQVKAGLMTEEQAATSVLKNIITRSVGVDHDVAVDYIITENQLLNCHPRSAGG